MSLRDLGWNPFFEEAFAPFAKNGLAPARVAVQHRGGYELWTAEAILTADVSGRFRHQAKRPSDYPAVGDWVAIEGIAGETRAVIQAVLPRRTKFSRTVAGDTTEEQLVATNIDEVFVIEALASALNVRRIERYLTLAWESGTTPTVVLTKADLCTDVRAAVTAASAVTKEAKVIAISCIDGEGIAAIKKRLRRGRTVVLLGPSGVGKSTLINCLAGEESQHVVPVREDDQKGRHTTTSREMVFLSDGGVIIDTPGLRELQLWEGGEGLDATFADIEEIATRCRFTNCHHQQEPGCAVRQAVQEGAMNAARLAGFHKLRQEVAQFGERRDMRARADERRRSKNATRSLRGRRFEEE